MSQTERINQIVSILESSRHPVPIQRFMDTLEVSRATFKRDVEYLRDRLGAPIEWEPGGPSMGRGYVLRGHPPGSKEKFGIQGLWFNPSEIHALLMMHQLAANMDPGLITGQASGLVTRIRMLLSEADDDPDDILTRIRVVHSATHRRSHPWFEVVAKATMNQKRLQISYFTRSRDSVSERLVSPKRLVHYRENWYLLAWCHKSDGLRLFSIDAIRSAQLQPEKSKVVSAKTLDDFLGTGFGVFGGRARYKAILRFNAESARWIQDEVWHPKQKISWEGEHLILKVPYSLPTELIMEILRHGSNVEVLEPPELRQAVSDTLRQTLDLYSH